jgi:hypothetical protein
MPVVELRRSRRTNPQSTYLGAFAAYVTSQNGEDGIIKKVFEIAGTANRWCVEFGAWDGKHLSNTWNLINNKGWLGVLIEGDPGRAHRLAESHRGRAGEVFVQHATVGWEGDSALDDLLARAPVPRDFDLLSVDIDGNDWHVWKALARYRPRLVVIEFNPCASNDFYFVQDPDPAITQGASLLAFVELAKEKGYELIATTAWNAFFNVREEFERFSIADNSIDAMYEPTMTTELCFTYDGSVFAAGYKMIPWHQLRLHDEDFQVLPKALRKYPDPGEACWPLDSMRTEV